MPLDAAMEQTQLRQDKYNLCHAYCILYTQNKMKDFLTFSQSFTSADEAMAERKKSFVTFALGLDLRKHWMIFKKRPFVREANLMALKNFFLHLALGISTPF